MPALCLAEHNFCCIDPSVYNIWEHGTPFWGVWKWNVPPVSADTGFRISYSTVKEFFCHILCLLYTKCFQWVTSQDCRQSSNSSSFKPCCSDTGAFFPLRQCMYSFPWIRPWVKGSIHYKYCSVLIQFCFPSCRIEAIPSACQQKTSFTSSVI